MAVPDALPVIRRAAIAAAVTLSLLAALVFGTPGASAQANTGLVEDEGQTSLWSGELDTTGASGELAAVPDEVTTDPSNKIIPCDFPCVAPDPASLAVSGLLTFVDGSGWTTDDDHHGLSSGLWDDPFSSTFQTGVNGSVSSNSATAPDAPGNLQATTAPGRVILGWSTPDDNDSAIIKFRYRQGTTSGSYGGWNDIPDSAPGEANANGYTVTSLNDNTEYFFQVLAVNAVGDSGPSNEAGATTPNVEWVLTLTGGSGTTTFQDEHGNPITSRLIEEGGDSATATLRTKNGETYLTDRTFHLKWGPHLIIGSSLVVGDGDVTTITVSAGTDVGSLDIISLDPSGAFYTVPFRRPLTAHADNSSGPEVARAWLSWRDNDDQPAVKIIKVNDTAVNADGLFTLTEGEDIEVEAALTIPTSVALMVPVEVTDGGNALNGTVHDHFDFALPRAITATRTFNTDATDTTPHGVREVIFKLELKDGSFYTLGSPSTVTLKVLDDDSPPSPPRNLQARSGTTEATLLWDEPADTGGGQPITKYEYRYRLKSSTSWIKDWSDIPGGDGDARSYTQTGLTNGEEYTFQLRAVNAPGKISPPSEVIAALPLVEWLLTLNGGAGTTDVEDENGNIVQSRMIVEGGNPVTATLRSKNGETFPNDRFFTLKLAESLLPISGFLEFAAGQAHLSGSIITVAANTDRASIKITAPQDTVYEVTQAADVIASIGDDEVARAGLVWQDDESPPAAKIAEVNGTAVTEGASFTVNEGESIKIKTTLQPTVTMPITVPLDVTDEGGALTGSFASEFPFVALEAARELTFATDIHDTTQHDSRTVSFALKLNPDNPYTLGDPSSVTVTVLDNDTPPSPPQSLQARHGEQEVNLTWNASTGGGGQSVTGYEARWREAAGADFANADDGWQSAGLVTAHTVANLVDEREYEFQVRAVNSVGLKSNPASVKETPGPVLRIEPKRIAEGQTATLTIRPKGPASSEDRTVTLVMSSNQNPERKLGGSVDDIVVRVARNGEEITPKLKPVPGGGMVHAGNHPHYKVTLPANWPKVSVTVTAVDDDISEDSESMSVRVFLDGQWINKRPRGVDGMSIAASFEPLEPVTATTGSSAGGTLVNITFNNQVEWLNYDRSNGHNPPSEETTLELFTGTEPPTFAGPQKHPTAAPGQPESVYADGHAANGRVLSLTFPKTIGDDERAWVVYHKDLTEGPLVNPSLEHSHDGVGNFIIEVATARSPRLSVADAQATEGTDEHMEFTVTLSPAATHQVSVEYSTAEHDVSHKAAQGSDFTYTSGTLAFQPGQTSKTVLVPISDDTIEDNGETFLLKLSNPVGAIIDDGQATATIRNSENQVELEETSNHPATGTPTISGIAQVGQTLTADTSNIADEDGLDDVSYAYRWRADDVDISGGTGLTYTLTVDEVGKSITVRVSFADEAGNGEILTSPATVAVAATVPGAPQQVSVFPGDGQELRVSWAPPESDGGSSITGYKVQWKTAADNWDGVGAVSEQAVNGTNYTIGGLTAGTEYAIRVMAVNGVGESLPSPTSGGTLREAATPLTASYHNEPQSHDGSSVFTFELRFSEEFYLSYKVLRDHAFAVTGATVTKARRLEPPGNIKREIHVQPNGNGDVVIELPITTDCAANGAICTDDRRMLSEGLKFTVVGPGG